MLRTPSFSLTMLAYWALPICVYSFSIAIRLPGFKDIV